ncbi:MAG: DnaA/Hda family protein, partial [Patescibacteria group bacterium]
MENIDKDRLWKEVLETIKISVSQANFGTWFIQTHISSIVKNNDRYLIQIGCSSPFVKLTIENRYFGLIQETLAKSLGLEVDLAFIVKENPKKALIEKNIPTPLFNENPNEDLAEAFIRAKIRQGFSFENFAVSSSNQMAWAATEAVSENPGTAYNPLFIWGGVGVGKTHLMLAVGYEILKRDPKTKVLLCTGEDFTNDIVEGIRNKTTQVFRDKYRKLKTLLVDDIQFIAGKDAVQEEFFHTFNAVTGAGGQVVLTSDKPP